MAPLLGWSNVQRDTAWGDAELAPVRCVHGVSPDGRGRYAHPRINARSRRRLRRPFAMSTPVPLVFGDYALEDRYRLDKGRVYLTGTQALVRLPMMQRQRDLAAGLNTGGFISGYRGSPLGGFDQALWQAKRFIKKSHIEFQ